jgi:cobyrinic acid a,c-diamide synthase
VTARVVIAGTSSGAGKTTVATGLLSALIARGLRATGFKVGPDFIDPSYHAIATSRPGRNLDAFMSGEELIAPLFRHGSRGADVAVIEGVMGLYDGASGRGELASTAHVAKLLDAPVVLVVDTSALARSVAAIVHGYATFDPAVRIGGVVLNRVGSEHHAELLREALAPLGIPVLGAIPRSDRVTAPERHLGLVPAAERLDDARRAIAAIGDLIERTCAVDELASLARSAPESTATAWSADAEPRSTARVAIAAGPAFSFFYEENLELLRAAGAELVPFDPLCDEQLPPRAGALLLAGGFPEVYGDLLSENWALRAEIAAFARAGRPVLAECGGLLYLARALDGRPMCGVIDATGTMSDRLTLGYREARATGEHPLWSAGSGVRGHEFHYSRLDRPAGEQPAWGLSHRGPEGHVVGFVHASYVHTHWAATPEVASRLVDLASPGRAPAGSTPADGPRAEVPA